MVTWREIGVPLVDRTTRRVARSVAVLRFGERPQRARLLAE